MFLAHGTAIRSRPNFAARSPQPHLGAAMLGAGCRPGPPARALGSGDRTVARDGQAAVKKRSVSRSTSVAVRQPRNCCHILGDEALLLGPAAGGACLLAGIFRVGPVGGSLPRRGEISNARRARPDSAASPCREVATRFLIFAQVSWLARPRLGAGSMAGGVAFVREVPGLAPGASMPEVPGLAPGACL